MKYLIENKGYLLLLLLITFFYQCISSNQPIRDVSKTFTYDVTYQYWISDDEKVKGLDLLIPIKYNPDNIVLDSAYFKNMATKLKIWKRSNSSTIYYVGRFNISSNINKDTSIVTRSYYSKLKDDESLVTYIKDGIRQYKILRHINNMSHKPFYLTRE